MLEQSKVVPISVLVMILTTASVVAILSVQTITQFIITNSAEAQQQQQAGNGSKINLTMVQDQNKTIGNISNQKAIQEVINATRNTNASGVLAGQIMNATKPNIVNQQQSR